MKQEQKQFYQRTVDDVMSQMKANPHGLTDQEVRDRREQFGPNKLTSKRRTTIIEKFFAQFKDLMIIILIVAAIIAGFAGETVDAIIILAVVILNAIFGYFRNRKQKTRLIHSKKCRRQWQRFFEMASPSRLKARILSRETLFFWRQETSCQPIFD